MAISNSKIKPIPKLPPLDEQSILDWLINLNKYNGKEACLQILFLLQMIYNAKSRLKNEDAILETTQDYLNRYISTLKVTCWDASVPMTSKEIDYAEIITWNYLMLARCFFNVAKENNSKYYFSSTTKNAAEGFALYKAIYALGQAQLHTAAIYCSANDGFWKLLYDILLYAEKRKLLDVPVSKDELRNVTVNNVFKQILTFNVCDAYQFRPRDMRTIFYFLADICHVVSLYKNPEKDARLFTEFLANPGNIANDKNGLFLVDLNSDEPPFPAKKNTTTLKSESIRYFSPIGVARNIEDLLEENDKWSGVAKNINTALFKRVTKTLAQRQQRKSERFATNDKIMGVVGFDNIVSFLIKESPEPVIIPTFEDDELEDHELELFAGDHNLWNMTKKSDNLNLAFKFAVEDAKNTNWNKNSNSIKPYNKSDPLIKEITIVESSIKGYSVYWNDDGDAKAKIDDIFGLILGDGKKRLEIALVRRITLSSTNNFRFGAEVIGFESEAVYLSQPKHKNHGCLGILIPGARELKQPDTLIYPIINFRIGDRIRLHKGNKEFAYLIARELYATSSIAHVEIDYLGNYD